jgi:hypothetical protein
MTDDTIGDQAVAANTQSASIGRMILRDGALVEDGIFSVTGINADTATGPASCLPGGGIPADSAVGNSRAAIYDRQAAAIGASDQAVEQGIGVVQAQAGPMLVGVVRSKSDAVSDGTDSTQMTLDGKEIVAVKQKGRSGEHDHIGILLQDDVTGN